MTRWGNKRLFSREQPAPDGEALLVRCARAGDQQAFAALVCRHQDAIYRLALRLVGPDAAEDVAQLAFLKAWQGLGQFAGRDGAAFGTWLYRIAINCAYDFARREPRTRTVPLDDDALALPDTDDLAETVIAADTAQEQRAALQRALAALPVEDRALLALRVGEGLTYDAIGAALDLNPQTVGSRLSRARARLHRLLHQQLRTPEDHDELR